MFLTFRTRSDSNAPLVSVIWAPAARVLIVRELGFASGTGLHLHPEALFDQQLCARGRHGHPPLILIDLLRNAHQHLFISHTWHTHRDRKRTPTVGTSQKPQQLHRNVLINNSGLFGNHQQHSSIVAVSFGQQISFTVFYSVLIIHSMEVY